MITIGAMGHLVSRIEPADCVVTPIVVCYVNQGLSLLFNRLLLIPILTVGGRHQEFYLLPPFSTTPASLG